MAEPTTETRTVISPRTGTKICWLLAIPLLAAAAYFFWSPITLQSPDTGAIFNCGSAASPPSEGFQRGTCGDLSTVNSMRAMFLGGTGLLLAILGTALFGMNRRQETRQVAASHDEEPTRKDSTGSTATSGTTSTATGVDQGSEPTTGATRADKD